MNREAALADAKKNEETGEFEREESPPRGSSLPPRPPKKQPEMIIKNTSTPVKKKTGWNATKYLDEKPPAS